MTGDRAARLLTIAREVASSTPAFEAALGAGAGDRASNAFMKALRERAAAAFGEDCSEKAICGDNAFKVDFYFPGERTIVEVALGLPNASTEFEKDILKAIMAQELGYAVSRLYFISRPGALRKCGQPGRSAVRTWARDRHRLEIEVHELGGEPRKRRRGPIRRPRSMSGRLAPADFRPVGQAEPALAPSLPVFLTRAMIWE